MRKRQGRGNCISCKYYSIEFAPYIRANVGVCNLHEPGKKCMYTKKDTEDAYDTYITKMIEERINTNESIQAMDGKE